MPARVRRDFRGLVFTETCSLFSPPPKQEHGPAASTADETELQRLATGNLLAHVASFLSVREGDVQNVLLAAPAAERIPFRDAFLQDPAFLSQVVFPGDGDAITNNSINSNLASPSTRHKIKVFLNTPTGAKFLRRSAGSSGMRPYTIDSDGRRSFDPSRFFANATVAIHLRNTDLLEWAMEVGSLDPNGYHDYSLVVREGTDDARDMNSLLYQCIKAGSIECFDWLLARDDVDPNAKAYAPTDRSLSIISACTRISFSHSFFHGECFLRRLLEHSATDVNGPSSANGCTPLSVWEDFFYTSDDLEGNRLEGSLRILALLLDAGANVHGRSNDIPTPYATVKKYTMTGSPELRARYLLAFDIMRGGGCLRCLWPAISVERTYGMVKSAMELGLPVVFLFELVRVITFVPFAILRAYRFFCRVLRFCWILCRMICSTEYRIAAMKMKI